MNSPTSLQALCFENGAHPRFKILNQLLLPQIFEYEDCSNTLAGFAAIRDMKVRGAPAIAIAALLCLACEMYAKNDFETIEQLKNYIFERLDYLCTSRPTAVNLFKMAEEVKIFVEKESESFLNTKEDVSKLKDVFIKNAESFYKKDIENNMAIGRFGAQYVSRKSRDDLKILTHCNTGSLATAGYGTALGIIRTLHAEGKLEHVFATETRPYNQGARLTAFELVYEKIPATLITDSMVSLLIKEKKIDAVIVGADRIVANGDTANKIGTYQLAITAAYHNIPFYVAAPSTSIDCTKETGAEIHIEERPAKELTHILNMQIAADGINVWNPSFDITPAKLISAIITEIGVIEKENCGEFDIKKFFENVKFNNGSPGQAGG